MTTTASDKRVAEAPKTEIGYAQAPNYNWWLYQEETTPELIWPQSISIYDSMRRTDSQVKSVLQAMTLPVRSTPWRIDPDGATDEVSEFIADNLGLPVVGQEPKSPLRQKDRFSWDDHVRLALLMLPFGHMYFEQVYRVDDNGDRAHLRKLAPRMPKTIERIEVAEDGGLISISQYWTRTESRPRPIPVNRLVAYINEKEGGNWLGNSILRPAYKNWLLKDRLLRVWAQTIERNGMGIPLYQGPENPSPTDMTTGLAMAKAWRAGEAAGSAIPFGADLRLVGVSGTLPDADPAVRYHDEQIGRAVLAHFLNLGTQTGSWALGTTFADFFTLSLQSLAMQIADITTRHVVEDLVDINFGPEEQAPRVVFDEIGSRQPATAQAITSLIGAQVLTPDARLEESLRQQYGLPPLDPETARGENAINIPGSPAAEAPPEASPPPPPADQEWVAASAKSDEDADLVAALIQALAEFTGEVHAAAGPDFERLHPRGPGGKFRDVVNRIMNALGAWSKGNGPDDPLPESLFKREHVRAAALHRGIAVRRGASREDIVDALLNDVREKTKTQREAPRPSAKFTLQHPPHAGKDVAVYRNKAGEVALYQESDAGVRAAQPLERFDSIDDLHAWAREHDETRLADWAHKERGGKAPEAPSVVDGGPKAPAAKTPAKPRLSAAEVIELQNMDAMPHNSDWSIPTAPAAKSRVGALVKKGYLRYLGSGKFEMTPEGRDRARSESLHPKSWEAQGLVPANPARKKDGESASTPPVKKASAAADRAQVTQIASAFHEDWRKTRLQKDGTFEPRVKKTKDQAWIDAYGTDEVDIANSSYDELPDDWKAENKAAAEVVQGILQRRGGKVDLSDEKTRLEVGEEVHQAWLARNNWATGGDLDVPFADLPADEQAKDVDQVTVAMGALAPAKAVRKAAPDVADRAGAVRKGVPRAAFDPAETAQRLRGVQTEADAIALLAGDPSLTSAKLRKVADELGIGVPADMRAKSSIQMHIAEKVAATPKAPNPDGLDSTGAKGLPSGSDIEVATERSTLTNAQLLRGEHLTPAGRRALDALGPAGHPRIAAIADTEGKIRETYRMLAIPGSGSDHYVALADVRKLIGEQTSRTDVDATLKRMFSMPDVDITAQSYARENHATRIPAAVMIGGQENNLIQVSDPTLARPSQFAAVAMAEELDARRFGGDRDPMMAKLSDAELQAEIRARSARDPFVAQELASRERLPSSDGLDQMDETALRKYAPEWGISNPRDKSADQLRRELREAGAASPAVMRQRADATAAAPRADGGIPVGDHYYTAPYTQLPPGVEKVRHSRKFLPTAADEAPGSRVSQAQDRIRTVVDRIVARRGGEAGDFVQLADLRDELGSEFTTEEVDKALVLLNRQPGSRVVPESNQKGLSQRHEDAAVIVGGQHKFAIQIEPPADAPASPSVRKMAVPGAAVPGKAGSPAVAKKTAPRVASRGNPVDTADARARLLAAQPSERRALLDGMNLNQTQARTLARSLGIVGVTKLNRDDALDRIVSHFEPPAPFDRARADAIRRATGSPAVAKVARAKAPVRSVAETVAALKSGAPGEPLAGMTKTQLLDVARELGISGAGTMRVADLRAAIAEAAHLGRGGVGPKGDAVAKVAGRTPARPVPIRDLFAADDATIEAALRDVYEGKFGPYTTRAKIYITRAGTRVDKRGREHEVEPSIGVSGDILDADGHKIGDFGRSISLTEMHYADGMVRREIWANHPIVQFYEQADQGKGFGGEFSRRAIDWYRASGVHGISLHDHNGYVWASQGFGFLGGVVPDRTAENIRQLISDLRAGKTKSDVTKDEYATIPKRFREAPDLDVQITAAEALLARLGTTKPGEPGYPTAYEISQLGRRPGQRGKTALWLGKLLWVSTDELILNPDEGEVISP